MPTGSNEFENPKFYIDGKEIPCEIHNVDTVIYNPDNDIDDFGLHFDPDEKIISLTCKNKLNSVLFAKLLGVWDLLRWYQKLWIRFTDLFGR